jgi:hypothetical protein
MLVRKSFCTTVPEKSAEYYLLITKGWLCKKWLKELCREIEFKYLNKSASIRKNLYWFYELFMTAICHAVQVKTYWRNHIC